MLEAACWGHARQNNYVEPASSSVSDSAAIKLLKLARRDEQFMT